MQLIYKMSWITDYMTTGPTHPSHTNLQNVLRCVVAVFKKSPDWIFNYFWIVLAYWEITTFTCGGGY